MRFETFEQFAEVERSRFRRTGARVLIAAAIGAVVIGAVILALPFG